MPARPGSDGDVPDQEVERLYGLPLEEFTRARNALVAELRAQKARAAAEEVKRLSKPTRPAWVVNQLARRNRADIDRLLDAGSRLREAHQGALGGGDAGRLRAASEAERKSVDRLVDRAEKLLEGSGSSRTNTLDRVRSTLHAVALDDELREQVQQGRVTKEREPAGLGPLGPAPPGTATGRRRPSPRKPDRGRLRRARTRVQQARRRVQAAERDLRRAEREAEARKRDVAKARDALAGATKALERAEA
jgi:hypothetical protein